MSPSAPLLDRALRQAGALIVLGLAIEMLTLVWSHPTAFLVFLLAGALLVAAGVVRYLLALLAAPSPESG